MGVFEDIEVYIDLGGSEEGSIESLDEKKHVEYPDIRESRQSIKHFMGLDKSKGYEWTFELIDIDNNKELLKEQVVKINARPSIFIESQAMGDFWIPMKANWNSLTIEFSDTGSLDEKGIVALYDLIGGCHAPNVKVIGALDVKENKTYPSLIGNLRLYGNASILEEWALKNVVPLSFNFGDLDFSTSNVFTIELVIRYSDAKFINKANYQI